jgi:hypothetical protein
LTGQSNKSNHRVAFMVYRAPESQPPLFALSWLSCLLAESADFLPAVTYAQVG